ncbi:lipase/esterase [Companilactobacillus sp. RD055328]|uniref:alpha/beta fold hydrolase n=1 Tax=Companilactobacillus sp. RD055328 TaxID=2916634 RepID=UPI001FC86984|nr:alpha/beta fold hydrolase [Companilactobacillus sp. RD055328]GKQ43232.1 lipase/esterase [Companilactobacillus sp. RD055328]
MVKVTVLSRDIKNIPVLEVVAEELRKEKIPIVIFYHGWKSSKELVLTQARKLAQNNLRVILPDAQNHGKRKQPISSIPSFTFWNSIQANIAEFDTIVNFYDKIKLLDKSHIGVGGYSMGGITTSMLLVQHPEITVGACIMGSPAPSIYAKRVSDSAKKYGLDVPQDLELMTSWIEHYDLNLQPDAINERPFLLWHGTNDQRIPFSEPNDFYNKIKNEDYAKNVEFLIGENQEHLVNTELMDVIADFFKENI